MDGFSFSTDVRIRFAETDAQGIAHHASFVVWLEVARVAYLARYAGGYQAIRDRGL
jgi:acyl-CoA thioester hydrolase